MYKVNITKYPTISFLAFAIFRTHFLKKDTIPMISGQVFKDIKESYTGGATDRYIPTNVVAPQTSLTEGYLSKDNTATSPPGNKADLVYCYDVNSLYPSVMQTNLLPTGKICYFEGNILNFKPDVLGFFYVKVIAPENLAHPIIQTHVDGVTMSPLGT
jgi:hypothetical protein